MSATVQPSTSIGSASLRVCARAPNRLFALISVIVREWDHQSLDPSPLEEALFYTHPAMAGRIRHALAWSGLPQFSYSSMIRFSASRLRGF